MAWCGFRPKPRAWHTSTKLTDPANDHDLMAVFGGKTALGTEVTETDELWVFYPLTKTWPVNLKFLHNAPFFQNGAKSGFEMCFGPSTLGAGAKTRLESRIKEFTPQDMVRVL